MRFLPKSLSGQLVLILLLALFTAQGVSLFLFAGERLNAVRDIHRQNVVARTVGLVRLLQDTPAALHLRVTAAASSGILRFRLAETSSQTSADGTSERADRVAARLARALQMPEERIQVSVGPRDKSWSLPGEKRWRRHDDDDHEHKWRGKHRWHGRWLTIGIHLPDGRWLEAVTGPPPGAPRWGKWFLLSLILTGVAIAAVAVFAGRRMAKPMRELAEAADRFGRGEQMSEVQEAGPRETRQTIRAFNQMQTRLDRYLRDRTAMLAAISHDLKTPITSLRLRAEFIDDAEMRSKILDTLDEMQAMTESTLDFIREDATRDPGRATDLRALAESVVSDFSDTGQAAEFLESEAVTAICRPTSLRRALRNLIDNAIIYGGRAQVSVESDDKEVRIVVLDNGPGIEAADLDRVFDPFTRLERSRNRATGGVGLGLAICRTIARAHGGDVVLGNNPDGGLRAVLSLPRESL